MAAASSSLRNLGRVLRNRALNTVDCGPVLDRLAGRGRSRSEVAKSIRTIFEALESRQLMSVLPAPAVADWQSLSGSSSTDSPRYNTSPSTAVNPLFPNQAITVWTHNFPGATGNQKVFINASYTDDYGATWTDISGLIPGNVDDPELTGNTSVPYAQATDATVAFDRAGHAYITYSEHNASNSGGAIVLARLDMAPGVAPSASISNNILYQWVGADSAWTPTLAVDNNLPSYTDPSLALGVTQTDPFAGAIYVAWATQDVNSTNSPLPLNQFNPNTVRLMSSVDQGQTFSSPMIWNANGHQGNQHAVAPKIVVSQGDVKGNVAPGQITVIWDDINSLRNSSPPLDAIKSTYGTQGGAGYYLSNTTPTTITDAQLQQFVYPTDAITLADVTSTAVHSTVTVHQMVVGDFDGNGAPDALVLNNSTKKLTLLSSNRSGTFTIGQQVSFAPGMANATSIVAGDFDGDGNLDAIVIDPTGAWLFTGNGDGTFNAPNAPVIVQSGLTVGVATDLDGDSDLDLLLAAPGATNRIYQAINDGTGQFTVSSNINIGTLVPDALALADFDGDGKLDLAVLSKGANTVTFIQRTGLGTFAAPSAPVSLTGLSGATGMSAWDFDGDGKADLFVLDAAGAWLLAGNGDGTFQAGVQKVARAGLIAAGAGDVDFDGDLDLVVADAANKMVVSSLNNGTGTNLIGLATTDTSPTVPTSVALGDFDGDGKRDMLVLDITAATLTLWQGDDSGAYAATGTSIDLAAANLAGVRSVVAGDFDGDGNLDAIVIDSNGAWLFTGNGDGTFNVPGAPAIAQAGLSGGVAAVDLDGDTDLDLVLTDTTNKQLLLAVNDGTGAFSTSTVSTGTTIPTAVAAGDFDGDGNVDIWVFDGVNDTAAYLQGTGPGAFAAPAATSLAPFVRFARTAVAGDFDGDGNLDVALADSRGVLLLLGNGSGSTLLVNHVARELSGAGFTGLAAGDVDGDGDLDVVVADPANARVVAALNNGTGTNFTTPLTNAAATPSVVVTGVFDSGGADAVVLNTVTDDLTFLKGLGNGTFTTLPNVPTIDLSTAGIVNPRYMTETLFDNDTKLDLLIVDDNGVWALVGNGDGTFQAPIALFQQADLGNIFSLDSSTLQTAGGTAKYADFDGDKLGDFVVMDPTNDKVLVALSGNGWVPQPSTSYSSGGTAPVAAAIADMDGDGNLDVVVANAGDGTVAFLLGTGGGAFSAPDPVLGTVIDLDDTANDANLKDIAVANIDGDTGNRLDVVALGDNKIFTLVNRTVGVFGFNPVPTVTNGKNIPTGVQEHFQSFKISDVDGDNKLDVVIVNNGVDNSGGTPKEDDYALLMFGNGTGAFAAPYLSRFLTGDSNNWATVGSTSYSSSLPGDIALGDFDGNGKLDVIVTNAAEDSVTVLLRPTNPPVVPIGTKSTFDIVFADPNFSLSDIAVDLGIIHPATGELLVLLTAPNGNTVTLIQNRLSPPPNGGTRNWTQTQPMGVSTVNLGYVNVGNNANYVGLTIGSGVRTVNDTSFTGVGTYLPEGDTYRNTQTLLELLGYNVGDGAAGLMGTWTLTVFDMVPTTPPPFEAITHFGVRITSNTLPDAGAEKTVATTTVLGALDPNNFPRNAAASGVTGIGPGHQIAADNTLGAFSPHQGRLYVTFVNRSTATGNPADNTDVMLTYSDDGGNSWSFPTRVNDDNATTDGYSEAYDPIGGLLTTRGRAQFQPSIAVDQFTGTLVISYYDARQDAARTRVARYIATSIDGGDTFGPQTFLNKPNEVMDASTGKMVTVGPVPDNGTSNVDPARGLGYQQGLAVAQGVVFATWAGNENGGDNAKRLPDVLTASTRIAAGPRVVSGTMGPVSTPGDLLNPAAPDGTPVLQSFVLTFDRPVQLASIVPYNSSALAPNVWVYFRAPGASGNDAGTLKELNATVTAVDPITHVPLLLDPIQGIPISLMDPNDVSAVAVRLDFKDPQTAAGTYGYYVEPTVHDLVRKPYGWTFDNHAQVTYGSDAANSNLAIPAGGTTLGTMTSTIKVKDMPASELVTDLTVNVNLIHTQIADLKLTLIDPDGNRYVLQDFAGASGRNLAGLFTSSDNSTTVDDLATLVTGLNNGTITRTGDWQLEIEDNQSGDAGFLQNWSITVTTSVSVSGDGNAMDQDADGINGETAWSGQTLGDYFAAPGATDPTAWDVDKKTFHTPYSGSTLPLIIAGPGLTTNDRTYVAPATISGNPNTGVTIPDATGPAVPGSVTSSILIGGDGRQVIDNLAVTVRVLHASVDTLNVYLQAPDGTKVLLYAANPAIPFQIQNLYNATFDDTASTPVDNALFTLPESLPATGIYTGVFAPYGASVGKGLSQLKGKSLTGEWKLVVEDTQPDGLTGTIDAWSISADTSTVIVNPTDATAATQPTVDSIHVTFDHDMDRDLMTRPGAIAGTSSPVLRIVGPAGPIDFATTYKSTDVPKAVADDNTPVASAITVADTYNVGHVTVKFDITHQSVGDLRINLIDPNGGIHALIDGTEGLTGSNFTGTTLDWLSTNTLSATSVAPFKVGAGYKPATDIDTALAGTSVNGTWKLQVTDANGNLVAGTLNSWSLTVTPQIVADPNFDAFNPDPNPAKPRTYKIYIPNQKTSGTYSLILNPALADKDGNRLDSDRDAGLDALRDPVLANAIPANSPTSPPTYVTTAPYVYTQSTAVPFPVAIDSSTPSVTESVLTVTDDFTLQGLTARLNLTFPNDPALDVILQAPDGTQVVLFAKGTGNFGSRANFLNTVFDDAATTPVQNGSAPYAGRFKPANPLSALVTAGTNVSGDWKLIVKNYSTTAGGSINGFAITAAKAVANTGLGEASDQATVSFRIFNMAPGNTTSSNTWTQVTGSATGTGSSNTNLSSASYQTLSAGSITDVAVDPSDPSGNTVFVAAASGGIWKTTNFLTSDPQGPVYVPVTDFGVLNSLNIGSIAVFARNAQPGTTGKLSGTINTDPVVGSTPAAYGLPLTNAFDGSFSTYYQASVADNATIVYDLGASQYVTAVKFAPRSSISVGFTTVSYGSLMVGGKFQGTNSLSGSWTDLYTVTAAPASGTLTTGAVANPNYYRYVRYVGPVGSSATISEMQVFGNPASTLSAGSSNQSVVVAGTGQGTAGNYIPGTTPGIRTIGGGASSAAGGNVGQISPGVGFLISTDGGANWNLFDSTTNVDSGGNILPINSPLRDHKFVGTATFKVVVDPRPTLSGETIIYAALTGTNGGLWRSTDTGKHWTLMRAGDCTDVILDYNSGTVNSITNPTGNLNIIYAGFRGEGIFQSPNRGGTWNQLLGTAGATPGVRDGTVALNPALTVSNRGAPNGNKGRVVLAMPSPTGDVAADTLHQGWIYAAVVDSSAGNYYGTLDGLYVTKDFGLNWTKISLDKLGTQNNVIPPFAPTNDAASGATYNIVDGTGEPQGEGNHSLSLTVDPSNPAVIYVSGSGWATAHSVVRVDTTRVYDAHAFYTPQDANDGGKLSHNINAAVTTKDLDAVGAYNPWGTTVGGIVSPQYINLVGNPTNPFVNNTTFYTSNATGFTNTGADAWWTPIDDLFSIPTDGAHPNTQRIVSMIDPLTGQTRLLLATDNGLYAAVANADGTLNTGVGTATLGNGSRNGNLATTQVNAGAIQPGSLAAQLAGAMFYAISDATGMSVSDPNVLDNGNTTGQANYDPGMGSNVATDQTGSGTAYAEFIPGFLGTDFFQVFTPGTSVGNNADNFAFNSAVNGGVGRTIGLITTGTFTGAAGDTQDDNWPDRMAFNFTVNPVNGNQIVAGTFLGSVYATYNQGMFWTKIAGPTDLDGTIAGAFAFGAPDADVGDSTSSLVYVGTTGTYPLAGASAQPPTGAASHGHVYVSFTGGGSGAGSNAWVDLDSAGLDGSPVRQIVTNPARGSHELYVVTEGGVYHMADSSAPGATWTKISGDLPTGTAAGTWTSVVADWRYQLPDGAGQTGTHPVLYVAGDAGVFRSLDNGATWKLFPNQDPTLDAAPADGGYLPHVRVTDLDLGIGNVNPSTGYTDVASGPSVLLASTYGRGQFAIRVAPLMQGAKFGPDDSLGNRTITGLSQINAYGNKMSFRVYDMSDPANPVEITTTQLRNGSARVNPDGSTSWVPNADGLGADGTFSVSIDPTYVAASLAIQAVDAAGVAGPLVTLLMPPSTPNAPDLAAASDSGASNSDDLTNVRKPTINDGGNLLPAGNKVTVYLNGSPVGSPVTVAGDGTWSFTFPGNLADGVYSVTVSQADAQNQSSVQSAPLTLTIDGTGPSGAANTIPGSTANVAIAPFTVATFTDAHKVLSATINWGDGTAPVTITNGSPANGGTFNVVAGHTYTSAGSYTVSVTATDDAGNTTTVTKPASIAAPAYAFGLTGQAFNPTEGSVFNGRVAIVNDGNLSHTAGNLTATINWGDGTTSAGTVVAGSAGTFNVFGTHTYLDDRQDQTAYDVTVTVTTTDGKSGSIGSIADVSNAIPTGTVSNPGAIYLGDSVTLTLTANDASPADVAAGFDYVINWGDGTQDVITRTPGNGAGITRTHKFDSVSTAITVYISDKDASRRAGTRAITTPITVKASPTLNGSAVSNKSDISQITFNVSNTDIVGGLSLSNLKLFYNGDGVNPVSLAGAVLTFDPASGNGTLDLSHLTTPLRDGDYQLQITVGGQLLPPISFFKLQGDINGDGKVEAKDLAIINQFLGKAVGQPGVNAAADLNHDGFINAADVNLYNKWKNHKATGGAAALTLQTGKVGKVPTLDFGKVTVNTNGGYIDLVIKNANANLTELKIGKITMAGAAFSFAFPGQAWGPTSANTTLALPANKAVAIRVYLKPSTKVQNLSGKLKFSFATKSSGDYKDVTVPVKATIVAATAAAKAKGVKHKAVKHQPVTHKAVTHKPLKKHH